MKTVFCDLLIAVTLIWQISSVSSNVIFCYYDSSSNERVARGRFGVTDLPISHCTHIVYSFLGLTPEGGITLPPQKEVSGASNTIDDFVRVRNSNPDIDFMVSIGGFNEGSTNFSEVASNPLSRSNFVHNVVLFLDAYDLHGIDLNWQYPGQRGGLDADKENFIILLKDLRNAIEDDFTLTVTVGVTKDHIEESYNVRAIDYYVDYINLMTFDYHGLWEKVTGVNAPLYPQLTDKPGADLNVNASVHLWLLSGAHPNKLVLGMAPYGKTFHLTDANHAGTGAEYVGAGVRGPYSQTPGIWATYEICSDQMRNPNSWQVKVEGNSYAYGNKGKFWVGYDTPNTMFSKGEYARRMGLAGIMFWSVGLDDFNGLCGKEYLMIEHGISGFYSV